MREFVAGGHSYRTTKLAARTAFHISRRLMPMIGEFGPVLRDLQAGAGGAPPAVDQLVAPIATAVAKLPDADWDFIIDAALGAVQRQVEGTDRYVAVLTGKRLQYEDIDQDLMTLVTIVIEVLMEHLLPFFSGLSSSFTLPTDRSSTPSG